MKTLKTHQTQGATTSARHPVCPLQMMALGPMAEATMAWAATQGQHTKKPESFEQWYGSLNEAFAAFDARKAS